MHDKEDVEEDIEAVGDPERPEQIAAGVGQGEHVHHYHNEGQNDAR